MNPRLLKGSRLYCADEGYNLSFHFHKKTSWLTTKHEVHAHTHTPEHTHTIYHRNYLCLIMCALCWLVSYVACPVKSKYSRIVVVVFVFLS